MNKYRTLDGLDYTVTDVGRTVNGEIETEKTIENANFELVSATNTPEAEVVATHAIETNVPAQLKELN